MDVPTDPQDGLCDNKCRHYFRRAKIAFDAGAVFVAERRVFDGFSALNNCHAPARQNRPRREENSRGAKGDRQGAANAAALSRSAAFLAEFGRQLEIEPQKTDPELRAYRLALLAEIGTGRVTEL